MWQELIVSGCVVLAAVFVLRRLIGRKRPANADCGTCRGCAQGRQCPPLPLERSE